MIQFCGHGSYPGSPKELDPEQPGTIAGLSPLKFQQILQALRDKNIAFMLIQSCYGGGTHSADIHLPDHTLPCPIYVNSSFDLATYDIYYNIEGQGVQTSGEYDTSKVLTEVQKMLFPSFPNNAPLRAVPRQLTLRDRNNLARIMDYPFLASKFTNLGTLFLPANKPDIPKVAYALAISEEILDVTRAFQKEKTTLNADARDKALKDTQIDRKGYLFTNPIVPFTLSVSGNLPMILLSRGGTNHHVINEILAPQQDIEEIANETFNAFHGLTKQRYPEPAYKIFFIGSLRCRYKGKEVALKRVMIRNTFKEREVLFQVEGEEDFQRLHFEIGDSYVYPWKLNKADSVSENEALKEIYQSAAKSAPSAKALLQSTAGRESQEDFMEALDRLFFPDPLPENAKLYSAMIRDMHHNPEQALRLKKALSDLTQNISQKTRQKFLDILSDGMEMASRLKQTLYSEQIYKTSYTPLMQAVEKGNLQQAQTLLRDNPELLEEVAVDGSTALLLAIKMKQFEIAKGLLEKGADINRSNHQKYTPFVFACLQAEPEFVEWILQTQGDFKGRAGYVALINVLHNKNWKKAHLLIDRSAGSEANQMEDNFLSTAIFNSAETDILKKLLLYPNVDVNPSDRINTPPIHLTVYSRDEEALKLLLDKGADPNQGNASSSTPLHFIARYGQEKSVELAEALLQGGAQINREDENGLTPLNWAIQFNNKALEGFLIGKGASLQTETQKANFPYDKPVHKEELEGKSLIEEGEQENDIDSNGNNPLQKAIEMRALKQAELLINRGIDINHVNNYGHTALHDLIFLTTDLNDDKLLSLMTLLIQKGAKWDIPNKVGATAKELAKKLRLSKILPLMQ